jgi:hypothetical protein
MKTYSGLATNGTPMWVLRSLSIVPFTRTKGGMPGRLSGTRTGVGRTYQHEGTLKVQVRTETR